MADKYRSSSARNLQAGKGSAHLRNTHICCGSTDGDAAGGRLGEPRDGAQQRRLAGAAAAEHEAQAVGGQLQADVIQDRRLRACGERADAQSHSASRKIHSCTRQPECVTMQRIPQSPGCAQEDACDSLRLSLGNIFVRFLATWQDFHGGRPPAPRTQVMNPREPDRHQRQGILAWTDSPTRTMRPVR